MTLYAKTDSQPSGSTHRQRSGAKSCIITIQNVIGFITSVKNKTPQSLRKEVKGDSTYYATSGTVFFFFLLRVPLFSNIKKKKMLFWGAGKRGGEREGGGEKKTVGVLPRLSWFPLILLVHCHERALYFKTPFFFIDNYCRILCPMVFLQKCLYFFLMFGFFSSKKNKQPGTPSFFKKTRCNLVCHPPSLPPPHPLQSPNT